MSGALSVAWMTAGWDFAARRRNRRPSVRNIQELGRIVEPRAVLAPEWRTCNVRVGESIKPDWTRVPLLMEGLISAWPDMDAVDWFQGYEEIHPFADGNGRTGNILYNWHLGTLADPVMPPNLWNDPRR